MRRILENEKIKGFLASQYFSNPFPFKYLKFSEVFLEDQGQGIGKQMVEEFTASLQREAVAGILYNSIEGPARDVYKNAGWVELENHPGWFAFNLPKNLDDDSLNEAVMLLQII